MTANATIETRLRQLLEKMEALGNLLPMQADLRAVVHAEMALIMADVETPEDQAVVDNLYGAIAQDVTLRAVPSPHRSCMPGLPESRPPTPGGTMAKTRTELDRDLDELATWVPTMLAETDEASQMDAFAGRAELIEDSAGPDDTSYVHDRLQRILVDNCMVPADEGPCA